MKTKKLLFLTMLVLLSLAGINQLFAQQLAFPTAEGYGKYVTGGRGGAIYEVTNLNSSGAGSFGEAISASGPRIVVFRVSGTITGSFSINNDNITIAGQTAPGDGICIKGNLSTKADNIIIRYIRVRYDPSMGENDALGGRFQKDIIFDHVSASWSTDETMTLYHNANTTVQWCIISQACPKGTSDDHRFGGIWGNDNGTWHHNLIAHNASRNPRWASGCGYNDYRNNVIYNWGYENCYGGEAQQVGDDRFTFSTINMIANYYKAGPATDAGKRYQIANPSARSSDDKGSWYVSDNYVEGSSSVTNDNWQGMSGSNYIQMSSPWNAMAINQESAQDAYNSVLDKAGCSFPLRDKVDADIIDDVRTGTAKYGNNGIIDSPSDVGGWPTLNSAQAPVDSDHDGMPDSWEIANSLNPNDASDRNNIGADGYTMVEIYINGLVDGDPVIVPVTGVTVSPTTATINKNETIQLAATILPSNATNKTLTWTSSNTSVASVSSTGLVTGEAEGSATITVTTQDGGFTATCNVTVTDIPVPTYDLTTSVNGQGSVSPSSGNFNEGAVVALTATPDAGWQFDNWSGDLSGSGNPVTITMNENKSVTANFSLIPNTTSITIQENETGFCSVDGSIDNNNGGFTGDGFANTDNSNGNGITWSVNIPTAGSYTMVFKYANGGSTDRTAQLMEDGSTIVSNISMPSTGSWTSWTETPAINANLSAGTKLIRLQATNSSGLANIDYITISGGSISAVACDGLKNAAAITTEIADKDIEFYPVPVDNLLKIHFNRELTETVDIFLYDMTGKMVKSSKAIGSTLSIDMSDLPNGLYTIRLLSENLNSSERIVKH